MAIKNPLSDIYLSDKGRYPIPRFHPACCFRSLFIVMITESPCPIKDRSEMVFIRDLCQNASSTALQCRYRRFSLIQIPGLLFSSTRCLFIKFCPYLNRSVSICKEPLIIYFCRSTFCTSCRCRRDRDHWDKSLLPLRWW